MLRDRREHTERVAIYSLVCAGGNLQSQNDQLLIMTKGKGVRILGSGSFQLYAKKKKNVVVVVFMSGNWMRRGRSWSNVMPGLCGLWV